MTRIGRKCATKGDLHLLWLLMFMSFSVGVVTVSDAFAGDYSGHKAVQGVIAAAEEAGLSAGHESCHKLRQCDCLNHGGRHRPSAEQQP